MYGSVFIFTAAHPYTAVTLDAYTQCKSDGLWLQEDNYSGILILLVNCQFRSDVHLIVREVCDTLGYQVLVNESWFTDPNNDIERPHFDIDVPSNMGDLPYQKVRNPSPYPSPSPYTLSPRMPYYMRSIVLFRSVARRKQLLICIALCPRDKAC